MTERMKDIQALMHAATKIRRDLVEPARAAAAQMKDAGMYAGAARLLEVLFQIDVADEAVYTRIKEDPANFLKDLMATIESKQNE